MSPRTGRPKAENPLNNDIKVRLDNATHEALLKYCKAHHMSKAEVIRTAIKLFLEKE